jgi:tRNA threonylcarbamoyladenosine biosynthesis protein TsaB
MTEHTLVIETATYAGSIALVRDREVIAERTLADSGIPSRGGREERVLPSVAECLEEAQVGTGKLSRIVCGAGPGSFTSLRIGASVAKGLAVGVSCPLYAVPSLLLSVATVSDIEPGLYLSILPAMRNEWFAAPVEVTADRRHELRGTSFIIGSPDLTATAHRFGARVLGPGQEINASPHARGAAKLLDALIASGPVPIETWEPDYGRVAEAQARWEMTHGRPLGAGA